MEGDIRTLRSFVLYRVDYQFFQTILKGNFDENNTSAYFYPKKWQIKADLKREHNFSVN